MKNISFYIARRYLLAKKGSNAVTFITWLAVGAMSIAISAMFIILSVFSGLEDLNEDLISNLHADLTVKSQKGKKLTDIEHLTHVLDKNKNILHYSKVIEEKVYINHQEKGDIAFIRGVDSAYIFVNPIYEKVFFGEYPSFDYTNEVIMENQLDMRLSIPVGEKLDAATLLMPKAGKGLIKSESDIFNKKSIYVSGVFSGDNELNNYIISPIELTEQLLELPKNSAYQIIIKTKEQTSNEKIKKELLKSLDKDKYIITTKQEENAAFWKMIKTEKLFIYLIFSLLIFITTFNLAGAIIILQLDKKNQNKTLYSLGISIEDLRKIYFYTGVLIVGLGVLIGLIIGTLVSGIQMNTGLFKAGENFPFPVKITLFNYLLVISMGGIFGLLVSWFFSKNKKDSLE